MPMARSSGSSTTTLTAAAKTPAPADQGPGRTAAWRGVHPEHGVAADPGRCHPGRSHAENAGVHEERQPLALQVPLETSQRCCVQPGARKGHDRACSHPHRVVSDVGAGAELQDRHGGAHAPFELGHSVERELDVRGPPRRAEPAICRSRRPGWERRPGVRTRPLPRGPPPGRRRGGAAQPEPGARSPSRREPGRTLREAHARTASVVAPPRRRQPRERWPGRPPSTPA